MMELDIERARERELQEYLSAPRRGYPFSYKDETYMDWEGENEPEDEPEDENN
jgi:hypothetical protein